MKKITLFLTMLLLCTSAMAQFEANKYYTVVAEGHNSGVKPAWAVNDAGTSFVSTGNTTIANENQKNFAFIAFKGATYIYSVSAKKFVRSDASLDANGDAVTVEALTGTNAGKYLFKFDNDHFINIGGSKQMAIDGWGDGVNEVDGGNTLTVTPVGDFTEDALNEALSVLLYEPNNTGAKSTTNRKIGSFSVNSDTYNLTAEEQLQKYVDKSTKEFVVEPGSTVTLEMTQSEGSWMNAFVYVDTDKNGFTAGIADDDYTPTGDLVSYSFYNQGYSDDNNGHNSAGAAISGGNRSTLSLPSFTAPIEPGTYRMRAKYDWCNINPDGDTGTYFGNTFTGHGAAIIDFTLVVEALPKYNARYSVSDMTGQTYEGEFVYNTVNHPEFEGANSITFDNINWDEEQSLYQATIDFGFPVSNEKSGALNEVLLDVFNKGKYLYNVGDDVKVGSVTPDASCSWGIYPIFDPVNESFTFKIRNVATGKYLCTNATGAAHNTQGTVFLSNSATLFTNPSLRDFKVVGKELYLSVNSPAQDNNVYLGVYGNSHDGTHIFAEDIESYNVTITDAKYATFYAPVAVTIPAGVTAYTVQVDGEWAILNEVSENIPSYTGVVLYAETANTYAFNVYSEFLYPIEGNDLEGTIASEYISTPSYVLSKQDNVVALYKAELNKDDIGGVGTTHFLNNHHKAYLPVPTAQGVKAFYFNFGGETTGIETLVPATDVNAPIYDLSGRRVLSTVKGGIYIQNGKKFIVK